MDIIKDHIPIKAYYNETTDKKMIFLHHTAGNTAKSSINGWRTKANKVATSYVIDRDGVVYEAFPDEKYARALGINSSVFKSRNLPNILTTLEKMSVQIELASWGQLTFKNGKYYNYVNGEVAANKVISYDKPYRGFNHYEKYTPEQIESLRKLISIISSKYPKIKLDYNEDMFELSDKALKGTWGIWTHTSVVPDKNDCHPQPELINMLKKIKITKWEK